VGLRLIHLTISRLFGCLRLSRRPESWRSAEICCYVTNAPCCSAKSRARQSWTGVWWAKRAGSIAGWPASPC